MAQPLLMRNRNYRLLFSASAFSNLGDGVAMVALPWLATLLTRDPFLISLVAMAQRLPWLLFALPVGVLTDRADRRLLMVRADAARLIVMLAILGLAVSGGEAQRHGSAILMLAGLAFLFGSAEVIRDNAAQTLLPSIVPKGDLEKANGQMWSAEEITGRFIGPPLAGLLIASSIALPFGADGALYAVAAVMVWLIVLPPRLATAQGRFWPALFEGLRWMRGNRAILQFALMLGLINAVFMGGMTILVLYAREVLQLGATGYGLLLTVGSLGGVLGGLLAPYAAARLGVRRSLLAALALMALSGLFIAAFSSVYMVALGLFTEAVAGLLWNVVTVSYRQRRIPDALLGRVNSVYRFFGWGAMPFGALGAGALVASAEGYVGREAALHMPYFATAALCAALLIYAGFKLHPE